MKQKIFFVSLFSFVLSSCAEEKKEHPTLLVDYSVEARELFEDSGFEATWDLENYDISGYHRADLPQRVEFSLLRFYKTISCEDASDEIFRRGFRPANFDELLAFGRQYPMGVSRIFALGTFWKDKEYNRYVPYLFMRNEGYGVGLHYVDYKIPQGYTAFLSVCIRQDCSGE